MRLSPVAVAVVAAGLVSPAAAQGDALDASDAVTFYGNGTWFVHSVIRTIGAGL